MDVKEFVDEYCQITGRPAYTITVDEFLKIKEKCNGFVQVPILLSGKEENVSQVEKTTGLLHQNQEAVFLEKEPSEKEEPKKIVEEVAVKKQEEPVELPVKKVQIVEKKEPIVQKPLETKSEPPTDQMQIALQMLKSIQG